MNFLPAYGVVAISTASGVASLENLEQMFKQIRTQLMAYASSITLNEQDAQDIVQEVFLECCEASRPINRAYLFRSVRNRSYNRIRGKQRLQHMLRRLHLYLSDSFFWQHDVVTPHSAIHDAMSRLPKKQQEVLLLRVKSELKMSEIGRVLGVPEGTVKSRINAALSNLKAIVETDHEHS